MSEVTSGAVRNEDFDNESDEEECDKLRVRRKGFQSRTELVTRHTLSFRKALKK